MQLSSIKSYAYSSVSGKDYGSAADLNTALKNAESPSESSGGSGGGGGSSGSGNKSNSTGSTGVTFPGTGKAEVPEINARFIDLNTVEWAYEAIMALADNGIVNGKGLDYQQKYLRYESNTRGICKVACLYGKT